MVLASKHLKEDKNNKINRSQWLQDGVRDDCWYWLGYERNRNKNQNSGSNPNSGQVDKKPDLHFKILVPVIKNQIWCKKFRFQPDL